MAEAPNYSTFDLHTASMDALERLEAYKALSAKSPKMVADYLVFHKFPGDPRIIAAKYATIAAKVSRENNTDWIGVFTFVGGRAQGDPANWEMHCPA